MRTNTRTTRLPTFLAENYVVTKPTRRTLKSAAMDFEVPKRLRHGLRRSINKRPTLQALREVPPPLEAEELDFGYGFVENNGYGDYDDDYPVVNHNTEIPFGMFNHCPNTNCNYAFELDNSNHFRCEECRKHYCLSCKTEYHHGKSCIAYKQEQLRKCK